MSDKFFDSKEEMVALTAQVKLMGVKQVHISFQGGGDSGEIYSIDMYGQSDEVIPMSDDVVSWTKQVYGDMEKVQKPVTLDKALDDIGLRILDATGMDWYNNEGGQGTVTLHFDGELPRVEVDMGINVTNVEDHTFEYDPIDDDAHFYPQEED
jgi:hypothetical protein